MLLSLSANPVTRIFFFPPLMNTKTLSCAGLSPLHLCCGLRGHLPGPECWWALLLRGPLLLTSKAGGAAKSQE